MRRDASDKWFSDAIRLAKDHTCEHCGKSDGKCEAAHIYGRRYKSVRWDTLNCLCLCHTCHRFFTECPTEFTLWLQGYVGQGYLDILNEKRNRIMKTNKQLRADIAKHYREEFRRMESTGDRNLVSW